MTLSRRARRLVGYFLGGVYHVMCCRVVRAALLALGVWCAHPQPYAYSSIITAGTPLFSQTRGHSFRA
jgi:hypothetical protein